jgi:hypothetical protein
LTLWKVVWNNPLTLFGLGEMTMTMIQRMLQQNLFSSDTSGDLVILHARQMNEDAVEYLHENPPVNLVIHGKGNLRIQELTLPHTTLHISKAVDDVALDQVHVNKIYTANRGILSLRDSQSPMVHASHARSVVIKNTNEYSYDLRAENAEQLIVTNTSLDNLYAPAVTWFQSTGESNIPARGTQLYNKIGTMCFSKPIKDSQGTERVLGYNTAAEHYIDWNSAFSFTGFQSHASMQKKGSCRGYHMIEFSNKVNHDTYMYSEKEKAQYMPMPNALKLFSTSEKAFVCMQNIANGPVADFMTAAKNIFAPPIEIKTNSAALKL